MATESSWAKWSNPATNNEWPSGGGCCSAPVWFVWLGCSVSSWCCSCCCCCSQAALPFPDLPFVCSFTFFIVSALRVVVSVVVGLTALCLVDFSCMCVSVCVSVCALSAALQPQIAKQKQLQLRRRWKVLSKMLPKCLTFCTVSVASCERVRPCPWPCVRVATWGTLADSHTHTHTDTCK